MHYRKNQRSLFVTLWKIPFIKSLFTTSTIGGHISFLAFLGQIYFNTNADQDLWVHNSQPALSKVWKQYKYKSFPFLLPLAILLNNLNPNSLEASLIINQVLSTLWYSMQFYLPRGKGGGIGRDGSESASSPLSSAHTDPGVLQLPAACKTGTSGIMPKSSDKGVTLTFISVLYKIIAFLPTTGE